MTALKVSHIARLVAEKVRLWRSLSHLVSQGLGTRHPDVYLEKIQLVIDLHDKTRIRPCKADENDVSLLQVSTT